MSEAGKNLVYVASASSDAPFAEEISVALLEIEEKVNSGRSIEDIINTVWNSTALILPRDRIGLSFIEEDGMRVTARYCKASYDDILLGKGYSAGFSGSSLQGIIDTGHVRIIKNLQDYVKDHPESESTKLLIKEGVGSSITLPLVVDGRRIGFMFFSSKTPNIFHEEHARILGAVLSRISQAVEKAWLIKKLEDSVSDYRSTLGFVSHELKSPLASMMARGEAYVEGYFGAVDAEAEKSIRSMMRTATYLLDMVNNYLDLARLESGEMKFSPVKGFDLREEAVEFALDAVGMHAESRGSEIVCDFPEENILIDGDPNLIRIAVINLLDNAVKYGNEKIKIGFLMRVENGELVIKVRNAGVGFTAEDRKKLFKRFSRLHQRGTEDRKGSGLGLYLTFWIAEKHGGKITAESEPGKWAEFCMRLPGARLA